MTPEQQRIAIASACGKGRALAAAELSHRSIDEYDIPNYPADLNAMHEAEKVLWAMEPIFLSAYCERLMKSRYPNEWGMAWNYIHATAAQRAEAFLRTLNLWKE